MVWHCSNNNVQGLSKGNVTNIIYIWLHHLQLYWKSHHVTPYSSTRSIHFYTNIWLLLHHRIFTGNTKLYKLWLPTPGHRNIWHICTRRTKWQKHIWMLWCYTWCTLNQVTAYIPLTHSIAPSWELPQLVHHTALYNHIHSLVPPLAQNSGRPALLHTFPQTQCAIYTLLRMDVYHLQTWHGSRDPWFELLPAAFLHTLWIEISQIKKKKTTTIMVS